jgi:protein tyrosine phosphatase (PTP) superfamily phosphohydrolase (DUF442 family)
MPSIRCLLAALLIAAALRAAGEDSRYSDPEITVDINKPTPPEVIHPIRDKRLPSAFRFSDKLITGASPDSDDCYEALQELGVKTIISVDGEFPDETRAEKYGMKYIHLPIPYKEVPKERALELAKAVRDMPGPIFMHCACGRLRSPAAAGVVSVILGSMSKMDAWNALVQAKSPGNYVRMYQCTQEFEKVDPVVLDNLRPEFKAKADVARITTRMDDMYKPWSRLDEARRLGWQIPETRKDLKVEEDILKIIDISIEISKWPEMRKTDAMVKMRADNESELAKFLQLWRKSSGDDRAKELTKGFFQMTKSCDLCHDEYRNK